MNKTSARILAIGLPLSVVAATGAAVAFWTGGGSGSADGKTASSVAAVTLATTSPVTGLVPGGSISVPVTATNPNASTSVGIKVLAAGSVTSGVAGCDTVAGLTVTPVSPGAEVIVAPASSASFGSVTIAMANNPTVNQDACKNVTFTVALTAS